MHGSLSGQGILEIRERLEKEEKSKQENKDEKN